MKNRVTSKKAISVLIAMCLVVTQILSLSPPAAAEEETAPVNVALAENGGSATASSEYDSNLSPASSVIDGKRVCVQWGNGEGWANELSAARPSWVQVEFDGPRTIDTINVIGLQENYFSTNGPTLYQFFKTHGNTKFVVQYWDEAEGEWESIPGGRVSENINVWRQFRFTPVTTNKIRVVIYDVLGSYASMAEIEAFTASAAPREAAPGDNVALLSNRSYVLASTTYSPEYDPMSIINGDRRGFQWGEWGGWRQYP